MLIDRPVEIGPVAGDLEVGLIDEPPVTQSVPARPRGRTGRTASTTGPRPRSPPAGTGNQRRPRSYEARSPDQSPASRDRPTQQCPATPVVGARPVRGGANRASVADRGDEVGAAARSPAAERGTAVPSGP